MIRSIFFALVFAVMPAAAQADIAIIPKPITKFFSYKNAAGKVGYEECIFKIGVPTNMVTTEPADGGWNVVIAAANVEIIADQGRLKKVLGCNQSRL